jgi:hypothetical protein
MRIAVLTDGHISRWQREALLRACRDDEIVLLRSSGWTRPRPLKHALYYALNLFTVRNRLTRPVPFPADKLNVIETIDFEPLFDGAWASVPEPLLGRLQQLKLDAVVKFGLGLMRVPPPEQLAAPILSFHHGDPRKYRGRPAGFYELVNGEPFVGQVVQAIGDKVDAGRVYAFAESRAIAHSYRKTLLEAYSVSPHLLRPALLNLQGQPLDIAPTGRNYRLPSNTTVIRFVAGRLAAAFRRVIYGAFAEKRWRVALASAPHTPDPCRAIAEAERTDWRTFPVAPPYRFYADPFFGEEEHEIFVEALNSRSGKGELVRIRGEQQQRIGGFAGHVSYPGSVVSEGRRLLVPETVEWAAPAAYSIDASTAERELTLDIDASQLLDPTLFEHDGRLYLFGNDAADGPSVLHLWHAASLGSRFERHPASPIRVSARGSRMAGEIAAWDGQLYRLGQDFREAYGDGILAFRIIRLDPEHYAEEPAGEARFDRVRGPHTLNRRGDQLLFDYYTNGFTPLAGVRRLLSRV